MRRARFVRVALLAALTGVLCLPMTAPAQKRGGTLVMLVQPEPPTLASYISTSGPIGQVATKVYEGLLEYDFNLKPIPSLAQSWEVSADGQTITLVLQKGVRFDRNPDYWRKVWRSLDRIVARFIADSATRTAAMEKGEAHMGGFAAIPWSDVKALAKLPQFETTTRGYEMSSPIVQLDFNTRRPPFDNLKVRQAVAYAINRKFVIDNVWFGWGKPATGPISSNFAPLGFYTNEVKSYNVPNGVEVANN